MFVRFSRSDNIIRTQSQPQKYNTVVTVVTTNESFLSFEIFQFLGLDYGNKKLMFISLKSRIVQSRAFFM